MPVIKVCYKLATQTQLTMKSNQLMVTGPGHVCNIVKLMQMTPPTPTITQLICNKLNITICNTLPGWDHACDTPKLWHSPVDRSRHCLADYKWHWVSSGHLCQPALQPRRTGPLPDSHQPYRVAPLEGPVPYMYRTWSATQAMSQRLFSVTFIFSHLYSHPSSFFFLGGGGGGGERNVNVSKHPHKLPVKAMKKHINLLNCVYRESTHEVVNRCSKYITQVQQQCAFML